MSGLIGNNSVANINNGATRVVTVADPTGLYVGKAVTAIDGSPAPANLYISAIAGNDVTLANRSGGAVTLATGDHTYDFGATSPTGSGDVTLNGGVLGGSGRIAGSVTAYAAIALGNSAGTLTVAGDMTLYGLQYIWELGATVDSYDRIAVGGALNFSLSPPILLSLRNPNALDPTGQSFTLFAVSGTTSGFDADQWSFDYGITGWTGGTVSQVGEDVVLSGLTPVPEPATLALLLLGGALAGRRWNGKDSKSVRICAFLIACGYLSLHCRLSPHSL